MVIMGMGDPAGIQVGNAALCLCLQYIVDGLPIAGVDEDRPSGGGCDQIRGGLPDSPQPHRMNTQCAGIGRFCHSHRHFKAFMEFLGEIIANGAALHIGIGIGSQPLFQQIHALRRILFCFAIGGNHHIRRQFLHPGHSFAPVHQTGKISMVTHHIRKCLLETIQFPDLASGHRKTAAEQNLLIPVFYQIGAISIRQSRKFNYSNGQPPPGDHFPILEDPFHADAFKGRKTVRYTFITVIFAVSGRPDPTRILKQRCLFFAYPDGCIPVRHAAGTGAPVLGQQNSLQVFLQQRSFRKFRGIDQQGMAVLTKNTAPHTSFPCIHMLCNFLHWLPPVFSRRHTGDPLEYLCKIALIGKSHSRSDLCQRILGVEKQALTLLHPQLA